MRRSIFSKISSSAFTKAAKAPHKASENESRLIEICGLEVNEALKRLRTSPSGLSSEDAEERLEEFGFNEPAHARSYSFWADIYSRIKSPLVIQLLIIAVVSLIIGEEKSTLIVSVMVLLSVGLSYVLDRKSTKAVEALGKRVQSHVLVLRDGKEIELPMSNIVPGDIVLLHAGSIIPADLRLIHAKDFFVSQSLLTGESLPIEKKAEPSKISTNGFVFELQNACFQGTNVLSGSARGVVVNTATNTYFGSISERLTETRTETSFDKGVKSFTWLMIRFMVVMVLAVFMIVGLTKGNWIEALLFGLSIAVGLTPEMLPMIVTVNLAKGALTMSKKKVIVKQLSSIQNFGAIDILCTDKTGTLTQDKVVLERHVDITGNESRDVLQYAYLNSFYQTGLRNLIDRAILEHIELNVEGKCKLVDELPFDFQRRRMSVIVEYEGDHVLICKGAVEEIYSVCTHYQVDDEIYPLIDMIRDDLYEEVEILNNSGYRVLAIGYRDFPATKDVFTVADEKDLILLGYIAFFDPPKESAATAIAGLKNAGVKVKILTGDNSLVTKKVCKDVGLEVNRIITGEELKQLSPEEFSKTVLEYDVFAKLSPIQKEEVITSLRQSGHVVGYMGDGINDSPSLRAADVGISVDSGVDVAKESADIVLLEKSLVVLEDGIIEGRKVFANIVKYIRMGASSNFGNMFSVLGASYLFPFLPMKPIQILLNNLLYDFSQTGIPTDNVDKEIVEKPLKWNIDNIKRFMIFIGPISSIFDYATYALMWFFFGANQFLNPLLATEQKIYLEKLFQTGWFVESLLTQTLIVHIIRTKRVPFIGSMASSTMTLTTLLIMLLAAWLPYSPFANTFGLVPLPGIFWLWIFAFLFTYSLLTHNIKRWFFKKYGDN
ncbi:magnesium-translocating P-type ATPase [Melioribacteraceae bacterium 4301-Me]|uniref:magnesium-translocating P-type ATPase n=1 Tax=Pyranulibacter aquaticus TaxID=3163344 RepID=UPI003598FB26